MVEWCPKCKAMLVPGQDKCPACGARLGEKPGSGMSWRDIFWLSAYIIGIAMIPILLAVLIGIVCSLAGR